MLHEDPALTEPAPSQDDHADKQHSHASFDSDPGIVVARLEYENARDFLILGSHQVSARFNYFLFLAAASLGGASAVSVASNVPAATRALIVSSGSALLLIVGLLTFQRIVKFDIARREYLATINLLRGYLIDRAPEVERLVIIPVRRHGAPWNWRIQSPLLNLAATVGILNSVAAGVSTGAVSMLQLTEWSPHLLGVSAFFVSACAHWIWQVVSATRAARQLARRLSQRAAGK